MARADLLIRLVQSGIRGDKANFRKVAEAIVAIYKKVVKL